MLQDGDCLKESAMPSPEWWTKLRAKLRPSKKATGPDGDSQVTTEVAVTQDVSATGANTIVDSITRDLLPYTDVRDALISAAPSEPASLASSAVSGGQTGSLLFGNAAAQTAAGLLPRMALPASGLSPYSSSLQQQAQVVVDPSFEIHSLDGRPEPVAAETSAKKAVRAMEPDAETQPKLTAAALGTHSTLSEGVARAHRGHRKMHFIKNWLNDAQADPEAAPGTTTTTPPPEPNSDGVPVGIAPPPGLTFAITTAAAHRTSPTVSSTLPKIKHQPADSPAGKSTEGDVESKGLAKAMVSAENARSLHEGSLSSGTPGPAASVAISPLVTRDSLAQPPLGMLSMAAAVQPAPSPTLRSVGEAQPSQPQLQHQPASSTQFSLKCAGSQNAAAASGSVAGDQASTGVGGGTGTPGEQDGVGAGSRWQSRPDSEGLENYLASAVTSMTVTSQVDGPDIPKRVAVPSTCSAVISNSTQRLAEVPAPPSALRLPAAASHESTKTIAVAGHCPEDIAAQQWSVDDFVLQRKLYEGALSVICHAQHKRSGRHVALKIYKRSRLHEMERFQLAREICLHIRILHPHILSLYAAWKDSKYVYLALEWAPHGNLYELLVARGGKLPEVEAVRHIIRPLLSSLAFLHSHSWLHRDIKLENVLLDAQGLVKLCDFGLAIDQKFEQANTRLGTFGYFAPEVLDCPLKKGPFDFKGEANVPTYGCKVDVWSMGVMSYELLTGKAPFAASSAAKIIDAIRSRDIAYPASLSVGAKAFLSAALVRDPEARASAEQLLQHPWIVACCTPSGNGNAAGAGAGGGGGSSSGVCA